MNWQEQYQTLTGETPQYAAERLQKLIVGWLAYQTKHPFAEPEYSLKEALATVANWIREDRRGAGDWNAFRDMTRCAEKAVCEACEHAYEERELKSIKEI